MHALALDFVAANVFVRGPGNDRNGEDGRVDRPVEALQAGVGADVLPLGVTLQALLPEHNGTGPIGSNDGLVGAASSSDTPDASRGSYQPDEATAEHGTVRNTSVWLPMRRTVPWGPLATLEPHRTIEVCFGWW